MTSSITEFELIADYFSDLGVAPDASVVEGVGDDCAVISPPAGYDMCLSIDTMVEGVHFPCQFAADLIASRALGAAASDLAAMGAKPAFFTLALSLPEAKPQWLQAFSTGLHDAAKKMGLALIGGDTTKGPLTISLQVHGWVPCGKAIKRSGARPGDLLAVTGTLGDAGAGLKLVQSGQSGVAESFLVDRYLHPQARLHEGQQLAPFVSSAIDISDGLLADASHLANQSGVAIVICEHELPVSDELQQCFPEQALGFAMSAGDDYELLVTLSSDRWAAFRQSCPDFPLTLIGRVQDGEGLYSEKHDGRLVPLPVSGFRHF